LRQHGDALDALHCRAHDIAVILDDLRALEQTARQLPSNCARSGRIASKTGVAWQVGDLVPRRTPRDRPA